jgi:hypothetical protein
MNSRRPLQSDIAAKVQKGWVREVLEQRSFTTSRGTTQSAERRTYKISDSGIDRTEMTVLHTPRVQARSTPRLWPLLSCLTKTDTSSGKRRNFEACHGRSHSWAKAKAPCSSRAKHHGAFQITFLSLSKRTREAADVM